MKWEERPYRPGVGIMMINRKNFVFVGQRIADVSSAWQMPQGGINAGEEPVEAMHRELYEETAVQDVILLKEAHEWYSYDLPIEIMDEVWAGRYRGQRQRWYLVRFLGSDQEIDIAHTDNPEFCDWKWAPMSDLAQNVVAFKRRMYMQLVEEFSSFLSKHTKNP